ncbi:MAG: stage III sporulation protein AE [Lawsonibacter sp.]|jgi:stage III sporulation protein AE
MKGIIVAGLVILACTIPCSAAEPFPVPGLEELWDQAESYGVDPEENMEQGMSNLFVDAVGELKSLVRASAATGLKLLAVVLLCSLAKGTGNGGGSGLQAVELAGALAITALTIGDMEAMIGLGRDTIGKMSVFSDTLLPVMAVLTAATGGVTGAAVRQGVTVFFSQILILVMDRILIPLVYGYVALSCAYAAVDNPGLGKLAGLLKSVATFLLTALLVVFVGYLTASGAIAGSVDASAIKAAKLAISRAIPVVGGVLADASETVLAGAGVLRGTVGVVGMLVVLAICATPFFQLAIQYLVYKGMAALCATVAPPRLSRLIDSVGGAFGVVLGMTGASALILLISLVSTLSVVVT